MTLMHGAKTLVVTLIGLRSARTDRRTTRVQVGLCTLAVLVLAFATLPSTFVSCLALACLPLARAQASTLWWYLVNARRTEQVAAAIAPDRELVHKLLWALFFVLDQGLILGARAIDLWNSAPLAFAAMLGPALLATSACLLERAFGSVLRTRSSGWTWLGVQAAAAWEEILFRGLACSLLWPLLAAPQGALSVGGLLFILAGALLFALPHHERGRPGGLRGVAITFGLGVACLVLGLWTGSILLGLLLHGGVLGSLGVLRSARLRAQALGDTAREGALFLLRLEHGYYVTDWEGDRIRRLVGCNEPLAVRIRDRLKGAGELVAIERSGLVEAEGAADDRVRPGLAWLRRWGGFLVVATPVGSFPPSWFPCIGLRMLRALGGIHGVSLHSWHGPGSSGSRRWARGAWDRRRSTPGEQRLRADSSLMTLGKQQLCNAEGQTSHVSGMSSTLIPPS